MGDTSPIERVESFLVEASATSRRHDPDATRYLLAQAADAAAGIEDDRSRRFALSSIAQHAVNVFYPELAQQLARQLIRLDRQLGCTSWVITDVLSYGSSMHLSRQHLEAEEAFRQAFDLALQIESWQQASAASSNYAAAIAARGALEEAEGWLRRSLECLAREPDLDTEIRTRAMLIQIRHALGESPASCLDQARSLIDERGAQMTDSHRGVLQAALEPVLASVFAANPELDPPAWVEQHFPELMEERSG